VVIIFFFPIGLNFDLYKLYPESIRLEYCDIRNHSYFYWDYHSLRCSVYVRKIHRSFSLLSRFVHSILRVFSTCSFRSWAGSHCCHDHRLSSYLSLSMRWIFHFYNASDFNFSVCKAQTRRVQWSYLPDRSNNNHSVLWNRIMFQLHSLFYCKFLLARNFLRDGEVFMYQHFKK